MASIDRVGVRPTAAPAARAAGGAGAGGGAATGGFPTPAADAQTAPAALAGTAPVALESLLALQQVDDTTERDRTARRHGQALLAALARLQQTLLEDGDPAVALAPLRALAESLPVAVDPDLVEALDYVVLRARIELVRRGG